MKTNRTTVMALMAGLALMSAPAIRAQHADLKDEIDQSTKAAQAFREIMSVPDKSIPRQILDGADCVAVFPSVIKAAFGIGGQGGRGVASCRTAAGWSAPAYFDLGGASFGVQIGADATDYVLLFMTPEAAHNLVETNFKLGAGAGVAAGPVGRSAEAAVGPKLGGPILCTRGARGCSPGQPSTARSSRPPNATCATSTGPGTPAPTTCCSERFRRPRR